MQNPQLSANQPVAMANEFFVLSRGGVSFSAKAGRQAKVEGSGSIYLSTLRMVFVSDRASGSSFDIPLATLYTEKFNQPIFGANNLTGTSPPLDLPPERDHYTWCIKFNNGGVGTFLPFFFRLLQEMRMRMQQAPQAAAAPVAQVSRSHSANLLLLPPLRLSRSRLSAATVWCAQAEPVPQAIAQGLVQAAFVDPNDPTQFYVAVPAASAVPVATPVGR